MAERFVSYSTGTYFFIKSIIYYPLPLQFIKFFCGEQNVLAPSAESCFTSVPTDGDTLPNN